MDGREGMAQYYMQRGIEALHGQSGIHPLSAQSLPLQAHAGGTSIGSTFRPEASPATKIPPHNLNMGSEPVAKRKRGRPRKYGPDGTISLGLSSKSPKSPPSAPGSSAPVHKRGRGRPPGSGKKQQLASLGGWVSSSAGMGFTPHIITIPVGEDIATKIMAFSQQGPRAVCILSANGALSTVTLRQPANSGGIVTYEGRFDILCLSGSYLRTGDGGSRGRTGGLSICLSSADGRVIGGGVGGVLIAATPVQVVIGSFVYSSTKAKKSKSLTSQNVAMKPEDVTRDDSVVPTSLPPSQSFTPFTGGYSTSQLMNMRNAHMDIDLTQ